MKNTCNDVALSEVIGFVLLLGLIIAALSLYMTYVVPISGREAEIAHMNRINDQFTDYKFTLDNIRTSLLVNNLSPPMTSTSITLGTGGGSTMAGGLFVYLTNPGPSPATLSVVSTGDTFNIDSSMRQLYKNNPAFPVITEFPMNITVLQYSSNNNYWIQQNYYYELGGVFLSQSDGVTNLISPLISFTNAANNSVVVNIVPVQVIGGGSMSGNGPVRVDTRQRILPTYNISTDYYLQNRWVNLSITSSNNATAATWLKIFNATAARGNLDGNARRTGSIWNGNSQTTTVFINITGTNADPNWNDVSLYVQRAEYYVAFNNIAPGVA